MIQADGFYEWKGPKGDKQPFFITLPNENPFAFAGLWEFRRDKEDPNNTYQSFTIITRDASEDLKEIHDRMPAVLHPDAYYAWLDVDNKDAENLQIILTENTVSEFAFRPFSKQVNSVSNNDPSNISAARRLQNGWLYNLRSQKMWLPQFTGNIRKNSLRDFPVKAFR